MQSQYVISTECTRMQLEASRRAAAAPLSGPLRALSPVDHPQPVRPSSSSASPPRQPPNVSVDFVKYMGVCALFFFCFFLPPADRKPMPTAYVFTARLLPVLSWAQDATLCETQG